MCRTESSSDKAAVSLARLEKVCDPAAGNGTFDCDLEAMDSSDNEVWLFFVVCEKRRERIFELNCQT